MNNGTFKLVWWKDDSLYHATGVIPVLEQYNWDLVFLNYVNGKWIPIEGATAPLINYSGFNGPITRGQLEKLQKVQ
jgi:hypothetical protein